MVRKCVPLVKFQNLHVQSKEHETVVELYPPTPEIMAVMDSECADI